MAKIAGRITKEEFLKFFEKKVLDKSAARVMAFGIINSKTVKPVFLSFFFLQRFPFFFFLEYRLFYTVLIIHPFATK